MDKYSVSDKTRLHFVFYNLGGRSINLETLWGRSYFFDLVTLQYGNDRHLCGNDRQPCEGLRYMELMIS